MERNLRRTGAGQQHVVGPAAASGVVEVDLRGIEGLVEGGDEAGGCGRQTGDGQARVTMVLLAPVIVPVVTSVAVIVWLPGELRVALKTPTPPVRVALPGRVAWLSVLVKWTVPV